MKKLLSIIYVFIFSLCSINVFANENRPCDYSAEYADLSEFFKDTKAWSCDEGNITVKDETSVFKDCTSDFITNTERKFQNEILHFKLTTDFYDKNGMMMVALRAQKVNAVPWGTGANDCLLFVLKKDQIELQRFGGGGSTYLACVKNPVEEWKDVDVVTGAVNTDSGVKIFLNLNGKNVILENDDGAVNVDGYFSLQGSGISCEIKPVREHDEIVLPIDVEVNEESDSLALGLSYKTLGIGTKVKRDFDIKWYQADEDITLMNTGSISQKAVEEYLTERKDGLIKSEDNQKFVLAAVSDKNNIYYSSSYHVDMASFLIKKGIFMLNNWYIATVDGEQKMIDENTIFISPVFEENTVYIPLRFVVEQLGGAVLWNDEDRIAEIGLNSKKAKLDSVSGKIDGQETAIKFSEGRILVDATIFNSVFDYDVMKDVNYGIVSVGREAQNLSNDIYTSLQRLIKYGN